MYLCRFGAVQRINAGSIIWNGSNLSLENCVYFYKIGKNRIHVIWKTVLNICFLISEPKKKFEQFRIISQLRPGSGMCWWNTTIPRTNAAADSKQMTPAGMILPDFDQRRYIMLAKAREVPSCSSGFGGWWDVKNAPYPGKIKNRNSHSRLLCSH